MQPKFFFLMQDEIIVHCPRKLLIKIFSFLFALHDVVMVYFIFIYADFDSWKWPKTAETHVFIS